MSQLLINSMAEFKCVETLGRIIVRGPDSPSNAMRHWSYHWFAWANLKWLLYLKAYSGFLLLIIRNLPLVLWRCWLGGRKGIRPVKQSGAVLVWLSVWSKVQTTLWSTYKLYDLHAIFYSGLSVSKKYFYVFLGNNFLLFLWRPLGNCPVCPSLLNPALINSVQMFLVVR